jgi:hypothetical protein
MLLELSALAFKMGPSRLEQSGIVGISWAF